MAPGMERCDSRLEERPRNNDTVTRVWRFRTRPGVEFPLSAQAWQPGTFYGLAHHSAQDLNDVDFGGVMLVQCTCAGSCSVEQSQTGMSTDAVAPVLRLTANRYTPSSRSGSVRSAMIK